MMDKGSEKMTVQHLSVTFLSNLLNNSTKLCFVKKKLSMEDGDQIDAFLEQVRALFSISMTHTDVKKVGWLWS